MSSVDMEFPLTSPANSINEKAIAKAVADELFNINMPPDIWIPFHETFGSYFPGVTCIFVSGPEARKLDIDMVLSSDDLYYFISRGTSPKLGTLSKLIIQLSVHLRFCPGCSGYDNYTRADLCLARDHIASELLKEIEARVKPSRLQSAHKVGLQALFLVLFTAIVAFRYHQIEVVS
jgi:hypothetical protein